MHANLHWYQVTFKCVALESNLSHGFYSCEFNCHKYMHVSSFSMWDWIMFRQNFNGLLCLNSVVSESDEETLPESGDVSTVYTQAGGS